MTLAADRVVRTAGGHLVLDGVTVDCRAGATIGLLGPNGAGKSTLLRVLAGLLPAGGGVVTLDGAPLADLPRRVVARRLAVVEQQVDTQVDLSVLDVVRLGRIPHRRGWAGESAADTAAVRSALAATGLADRGGQSWHTLSGGERQRVQLARALAQEPRELLLDEPTNHLDIAHQLDLLHLVTTLPVTTVVALHDLNLAAMFCDHVVVLRAGRVVVAGAPVDVLTEDLIADVYGVRAVVSTEDGQLHVRFRRTAAR
ncbi:ABC transporter (iron.B12.siderophore.hemin), ATP-binding component [Actinokineospora spheciospongiae]|uniref:ABC transporter (Iron.B12.siderophore.hemin), ATP-binding component n=1 Tax=Actinokineospora spheciospongiae TaxID=909613 RepID=W7IVC9_9PSEU|nr:ABC transporter ATP-binding protein [Actinokineospora spheciospongiae]EWC64328.1 ABC transporter (iron.B12.siderophore.hemin), ATP-binding component [Actinokineospora spheciospongiae]PWW63283.1 iron complex transport system ATP-binding protein [Actinokineospora spheciospongiae]